MADPTINTKPLEDAFERMARSIRNQEHTSYKLSEAFDKLGETGVKELTDKIKLAAKQSNIFTDAQLKLIKTTQDLEDGIKHQEKELGKRSEAEKELRKSISETIKLLKSDTLIMQADIDATKVALDLKFKALAQLKQEAADKKANMAAFRATTEALIESATSIKSWEYHLNKSTDSIKGWAASQFTARKSLDMLKTAGVQLVGELNKATAVGLQDSFFTISKEAFNLKMSFDEFSDVIAKNRDIIRQLGGGSEGISNFQTVLKEASKGLAYMGKDGTVATARFIESMKTMGITVKDTDQFGKTIASTQKRFTRWSAVYGDTADSFADVTESQMKSSSVQAQMIQLLPKQRDALKEEIYQRIENSKNLGLSNEQIKNFSDGLEHALDPHKLDIPNTIKQAASSVTHLQLLAQRDPNNKVLQDAVDAMVKANQDLMDNPMMGAEAFKKSITNIQPELLQEIGKAEARTTAGTKNKSEMGQNVGLGITEASGGEILSKQLSFVNDAAVAHSAALDTEKANAKKIGDLAEKQVENQSAAVKGASVLRDVMQTVTSAMQNSLVVGALAAGTAIIALGLGIWKVKTAVDLLALATDRLAATTATKGATNILNDIPDVGKDKEGGGKGKWGKVGRLAGRFGGSAMAIGSAGYEGYNTYEDYNAGKISENEKNKGYGKAGGALAGGIAGAELGALAGAPLAPVTFGLSSVVGGLIGGGLGAWGGGSAGEAAGGKFGSKTSKINQPTSEAQAVAAQAADFGSKGSKINQPTPEPQVTSTPAVAAVTAPMTEHVKAPTEKSNIIEELKKHTEILKAIQTNTFLSFKPPINPDMYKSTAARVASNAFNG